MEILKKIDEREIRKIKKLEEKTRKNNFIFPGFITYRCETFDKDGNIKLVYEDKSRSRTRFFYNNLSAYCLVFSSSVNKFPTLDNYSSGGISLRDTGGTKRTNRYINQLGHDTGSILKSIVVGSGGAAESFEDYKLQTPITHGTGSGQLEYLSMSAPVITWESGDKRFKAVYTRYFNNRSGGTVTVREIGFYGHNYIQSQSPTDVYYCIIRDVPSSEISIADNDFLKVEYTFYAPIYPQ